MLSDHEQWLAQAVDQARAKRYDEARELALRVVREDGRNPKALWIVASTTASLTERRNALKALLRVQPDNLHAQKMLNTIDQEFKTSSSPTATAAVHSIEAPTLTLPPHLLLYAAIAIGAMVLVGALLIAAGV